MRNDTKHQIFTTRQQYIDLEDIRITSSLFEKCQTALNEGGAVYYFSSFSVYQFLVRNSAFDECGARSNGGGIYIHKSLITIASSCFRNCYTVEGTGDSVHISNSTQPSCSYLFFADEKSLSNSPAFYCNSAIPKLIRINFTTLKHNAFTLRNGNNAVIDTVTCHNIGGQTVLHLVGGAQKFDRCDYREITVSMSIAVLESNSSAYFASCRFDKFASPLYIIADGCEIEFLQCLFVDDAWTSSVVNATISSFAPYQSKYLETDSCWGLSREDRIEDDGSDDFFYLDGGLLLILIVFGVFLIGIIICICINTTDQDGTNRPTESIDTEENTAIGMNDIELPDLAVNSEI